MPTYKKIKKTTIARNKKATRSASSTKVKKFKVKGSRKSK